MAAPTKSMTSLKETSSHPERVEGESLTQLLSRLGEDVMQLLDSKFTLLKVELKEEARTYLTSGAMIGIGAGIAMIGFALLNVAVALGVSTLFSQSGFSAAAQFALGFVLTGAFYVIVGAVLVLAMKSRLAKVDLVPDRFVEELRKDKQWLKNEL
jgi:uncharacterized membrane protein YqjE